MTDHYFERDDDVVFARFMADKLNTKVTPMVFCEGGFWSYSPDAGAWVPFPRNEVKLATMQLSGMRMFHKKVKKTRADGTEYEIVETKALNVTNAKLKGVAELVTNILEDNTHFAGAELGLSFTNGFVTVDNTGIHLKPNSPTWRSRTALAFPYRSTKATPAEYAPKWSAFMNDVTRGDPDAVEKQAFLQEFVGIALLGGSVFYEKAALLVGGGSNGKSVFLDVVQSIFPSRNLSSIPPQQLGDEYYRARLDGVILNVVSELPKRDIVDSPALNGVISGDQMEARRPCENPFQFRPRAGHLFAVNPPLPTVADLSGAFWRRFVVIAFNRDFTTDPAAREKEALVADLKSEAMGIVRWALEGARRVKANGKYTLPSSSAAYLKEWRTESDQVALFLRERTVACSDEQKMYGDEDLYRAYRKWAENTGHSGKLSLQKFSQRMTFAGFKPVMVGGLQCRPLRCDDTQPSRQWALSGVRSVQSPLKLVPEEDGYEDPEDR